MCSLPAPLDADDEWLLTQIQRLDTDARGNDAHCRASAAMAVAFGPAMAIQYGNPGIHKVVAASQAWLNAPSDEHWTDIYHAATMTYAFGPGEGCHSVPELGGGCREGSGCRTGIGWLWSLRHSVGAAAVRRELEPVLAGLEY